MQTADLKLLGKKLTVELQVGNHSHQTEIYGAQKTNCFFGLINLIAYQIPFKVFDMKQTYYWYSADLLNKKINHSR